MKNFTLGAMFALLLTSQISNSQVVVNEVMSSNTTVLTDDDGTYQDWVELYNAGNISVNLNGYGLTDDPASPYKWVFPNITMAPGEYRIVFCSDKNRTSTSAPLHTNWKISNDGEVIQLTSANGTYTNASPATPLATNAALARVPDGTGPFTVTVMPTPGAANQGTSGPAQLSAPVFSHPSGFYTADFDLTITTNEPDAVIVYTLDGSDPDIDNLGGTTYNYKNQYPQSPGQPYGPMLFNSFSSLSYSASIPITDRTPEANKISMISSTYDFNPPYFPSTYNIFKGTVVRAKVVKPGVGESATISRNYFVNPSGAARYSLPVMSISVDENQLFDYDDGIYVAGKIFDMWRAANPLRTATSTIGNYDQKGGDTEREANMQYFVNGQQVLNQNIGIRVQGNYSRIYPLKSLNLYARQEYGDDTFDYPFYSDQPYQVYKRAVLKNNGSDMYNTVFRDPLVNELAKGLNTQTEAYQPVVTFLNGEYWGIMSLRERYDEKFFNRVYGIPENEVDLLENDGWYVEEGDNDDYIALFEWIEDNSLVTPENYSYITTKIDPDSFTDYFITNIFLQNKDWPGNNIIFWRRSLPQYDPGAPYGNDGRWRWAIHDVTSTFSNAQSNTLAVATDPNGPESPNPSWSTLWLRRLLENEQFKTKFITRFADLMNTYFLPSRVNSKIDQMAAVLAPEINEMSARWKAPFDYNDWLFFINKEKQFSSQRPDFQREHIRQQFNIANNINVTVSVSNAAQGYVKVNTIDIKAGTPGISANPYPWLGVYFSDIPVTLKAIALPGFQFSHWSGASTSTDEEITVTSSTAFAVTAHFEPATPVEVREPVYFWMMNTALPNDTPLQSMVSTFDVPADGVLQFQSCLPGYPYVNGHPLWRKASMERRNSPTEINYIPTANNNIPFASSNMRGLQVTQPFQQNGMENTMIFNLSTVGYKDVKFSFAAKNENAADGLLIDYSTVAGAPQWISSGITSAHPMTSVYQLFEIDFSDILEADANPNFRIRIRFTGSNMTADNGDRVTFNNFAMTGIPMSISYPSPNTFVTGTAIMPLAPTVTGNTTFNWFSISPDLPAGLSINPSTGIISGVPTAPSPATTYTVSATHNAVLSTTEVVIAVDQAAPSNLAYNTPNVFTVGLAIPALMPTVTGPVVSYSVAPALPAGLTLDPVSGIISGTPTVLSPTTTYTVTATNSGGSASFGVVITVNDVAPGALSYNSPNVLTVGSSIVTLQPTVSGTVTSWSISPALPAGLSFDENTGVISGTPTTVTSTETYTVTATNSGGSTSFGVMITVNDVAPGALSYNTPNVFTVGSAIVPLVPAIDGDVIAWSISPELPAGLSFDTATGIISGTPTAVTSTETYTVTATNSGGSASFGVVITVNDVAPGALSYNSPNVFTVGSTIVPLAPTIDGDVIAWSISPALPAGLSFDTTSGIISGTPTTVTSTETYTVTATNSGGSTSFGVVITVNDVAPGALSYSSPNVFTVGSAIVPLAPTIDGDVITWNIAPALPAGLSFDTATGIISGTPTVVTSTATYTVTATNSGGSASFGVVITVNDVAPGALSYNSPNIFTVGTTIVPLAPTIDGDVIAWTISPALPAGLSFDTATGIISGTPTSVTATTTYIVTATNSGGSTSFGVMITVNDVAPGALSYSSPNVFTVGSAIVPLAPTIEGDVVTWSISPTLPNGLSFDVATGIISGTPTTVTSTTTYTVTATNSGGSISFGVVIAVNDVAPGALSYNTPNVFTVGSAIVLLQPTMSGTVTSWSISPVLPEGLSFDVATGIISGTPTTVTSTETYTVTATNSGGNTSFGVMITVNDVAPGALSYNSPNVFTVGSAIVPLAPTIDGDVITWNIAPALPAGLSFDTATGIISGTPTSITATTTYIVTATNSGGSTSFGVMITVNDVAPGGLSYNSPNVFTVGSAIVPLAPTIDGDVIAWTISPALPTGLSFDTATGIISGTPTTVTSTTTYTVTATNSGGSTSFGVVITVNDVAPGALSYNTPNVFTVGSAIVPLVPTIDGDVIAWSISPALPAGLSFDTTSGIISGTPTTVTSTETYTVTATNSGGSTSFGVVITVNDVAPGTLSYNSPNVFTVGSAILPLVPTIDGQVDLFTISPELPVGLNFDVATGIISGTPEMATPSVFYTVTAINSGGAVSFDVQIKINDLAPIQLFYTNPNIFIVGTPILPLIPDVMGQNLTFTSSPPLPDGLVLDAASGFITGTPTEATQEMTYTITATNSGGSVSFDLIIRIDDELGTVNPDLPAIVVYPNPFEDIVRFVNTSGAVTYQVFSADGKKAVEGTSSNSIDLSHLPAGMYLLHLADDNGSGYYKIIKK